VSDSTGATVSVGTFQGTATFGQVSFTSAGGLDFYVAKYTSDGELAWVRTYGGTGNDAATSVALDQNGNVVVAGTSDGPLTIGASSYGAGGATGIFYLELTTFGDLKYSNAFGGVSATQPVHVGAGLDGVVALVGTYTQAVDFGGGPLPAPLGASAAFIAAFSDNGTYLFADPLGADAAFAVGNGIACSTTQQTFAVVGTFAGTGTFPTGSTATLTTKGVGGAFVATFDATGAYIISQAMGGDDLVDGLAVALTGGGDIVVGGDFSGHADLGAGTIASHGGLDAYVAELTSAGGYAWSRTYGGPGVVQITSVAGDTKGNVVAAGTFEKSLQVVDSWYSAIGESDIFAVKLDPTATLLWSGHFGGPLIDQVSGTTLDGTGAVGVTGFFQGTADFGTGKLTSAGDYDAFTAAYAP
jgi:hypothetical protein